MSQNNSGSEPVFNLPPVIVSLTAVLLATQIARDYILDPAAQMQFLLFFSFIPGRYLALFGSELLPGGMGAEVWSPLTYGLLHANWEHLLLNLAWLLAFGTPVARRLGTQRFLGLAVIASVLGAGVHFAIHPFALVPVIGASAAISGVVAAAARFVFSGEKFNRATLAKAATIPAPPLRQLLRNRQVVIFLALWFGTDLLFGLVPSLISREDITVAWEAHMGGFLVGFFLFPWLDPKPKATPTVPEHKETPPTD